MSRRAAGLVLGAALLLLVGGLTWWLLAGRSGQPGTKKSVEEVGGPVAPVQFILYFPADGGRLAGERRELQVTESPRDRSRKIVQGLLAGPKAQNLYRPFPQGVRLGSVLLVGDVLYLDMIWDGHPEPPSSGATEEIQRIYSVIDSICLNVPQVQRVVLLWNGFQRLTFGHLDLSRPMPADRSLVAP